MVALTRREQEIARLVASGQTEASIATMLSISIRSVEDTLHSVYAKCCVSNPTELASVILTGRSGRLNRQEDSR